MSSDVTNLISKVKKRGHDVWEAGPATADAVHNVEQELGTTLPPSYVSFLLSHGSMVLVNEVVSGIVSGNRIRGGRGTVLSDTETLRSAGCLPAGLIVIGPHEDGGYCLDLRQRRTDGECPIVNYEIGSVQHEETVAATFEEWLAEWRLKPLSEYDA